jgi:hypothetical protein
MKEGTMDGVKIGSKGLAGVFLVFVLFAALAVGTYLDWEKIKKELPKFGAYAVHGLMTAKK